MSYLKGEITLPGDKSVSHRFLLLAALAEGVSTARHMSLCADVRTTLACVEQLGCTVVLDESACAVTVHGDLKTDAELLQMDCGNSGTTMRLLCGLLGGLGVEATLTGDASLSKRPMRRVVEPLQAMGVEVVGSSDGTAPIHLSKRKDSLKGITIATNPPSAQVKSALLFAALFAEGETLVREAVTTRDHTERMMRAFGVQLTTHNQQGYAVQLCGPQHLRGMDYDVPGDFSSALYFIVGALICPGSAITLRGVGLNPTRTHALTVLRRMGADIVIENVVERTGEPRGDITVDASPLRGTTISADEVPLLIDEIPALMMAAIFAEGHTTIDGVGELRHKESDRAAAMEAGLRQLGVPVILEADRIEIRKDTEWPQQAASSSPITIDTRGDHRIAMAFLIAKLATDRPLVLDDTECIGISFPGFMNALESLAYE